VCPELWGDDAPSHTKAKPKMAEIFARGEAGFTFVQVLACVTRQSETHSSRTHPPGAMAQEERWLTPLSVRWFTPDGSTPRAAPYRVREPRRPRTPPPPPPPNEKTYQREHTHTNQTKNARPHRVRCPPPAPRPCARPRPGPGRGAGRFYCAGADAPRREVARRPRSPLPAPPTSLSLSLSLSHKPTPLARNPPPYARNVCAGAGGARALLQDARARRGVRRPPAEAIHAPVSPVRPVGGVRNLPRPRPRRGGAQVESTALRKRPVSFQPGIFLDALPRPLMNTGFNLEPIK
jgi:hypothetical protein